MRIKGLLILVAVLTLVSCNKHTAGRAPWTSASGANQSLMDGDESAATVPTSGSALLAVTDVTCDTEEEGGYLVEVSWVTTIEDLSSVEVEYDVGLAGSSYSSLMDNPILGQNIADPTQAGATNFTVPSDKLTNIGDELMVRVVVESYGNPSVMSPVDIYKISELCN